MKNEESVKSLLLRPAKEYLRKYYSIHSIDKVVMRRQKYNRKIQELDWDLSAPAHELASKWLSSDGLFLRDRSDSDSSLCHPRVIKRFQATQESLSDPIPWDYNSLSDSLDNGNDIGLDGKRVDHVTYSESPTSLLSFPQSSSSANQGKIN